MKLNILTILFGFKSCLSDFCDDRVPKNKKSPSINHSNPNNKPRITTCMKHKGDPYSFCRCFDSSGREIFDDRQNQASSFCCQCPETLDETYTVFKVKCRLHFQLVSNIALCLECYGWIWNQILDGFR